MATEAVKNRPPSPPRTGRPRDPDVEARIFAAVLELLADGSYADATIGAVARRAGVSRPTIYRRWSSRSELVQAALFGVSHSADMDITGDLVNDLTAWVDSAAMRLSRRAVAAALPGLLAEGHDSDRGRALLAVRREHFHDILDGAVRSGSVRDDVDADVVLDLLLGALFLHVASGQPIRKSFRRQLVTLIVAAVSP